MVPELRKFKRETYILAQAEGHLDSSSVVGIGLPQSGANLSERRVFYLVKHFQVYWAELLCSVLHYRDKMTSGWNIFMANVIKDSSPLEVKSLLMVLVGCLILSKLCTWVMKDNNPTLDFMLLLVNIKVEWTKRQCLWSQRNFESWISTSPLFSDCMQ